MSRLEASGYLFVAAAYGPRDLVCRCAFQLVIAAALLTPIMLSSHAVLVALYVAAAAAIAAAEAASRPPYVCKVYTRCLLTVIVQRQIHKPQPRFSSSFNRVCLHNASPPHLHGFRRFGK